MLMKDKIMNVLSSIRFWQLTLAAAFVLVGHYFPQGQFLWNTLATFLATVTGLGTLDSVAQNIAGTKTPVVIVTPTVQA